MLLKCGKNTSGSSGKDRSPLLLLLHITETDQSIHRTRDGYTEPIPKRDSKTNVLLFPDAKDFRPNMTPKEVLQKGSFGGTYYRPIKSSVTGLKYNKVWLELPQNWLEGLEVRKKISSSVYDEGVNTYKVKRNKEVVTVLT